MKLLMDKNEESFKRVIPKYAAIPLAIMVIVNFSTYQGTRFITQHSGIKHYNMATSFDEKIPLVPIFVVPYVLAYVQWILGFIIITRESKRHCYYIGTAEVIAKLLTAATYLLVPTIMYRPEIKDSGIFTHMVAMVYGHDSPDNLFPSIHCLESLFVLYGTWQMTKVSNYYKYAMFVMTSLVCMSTVFMRQHVIVDMFASILYMTIGLVCSKIIYSKIILKDRIQNV